MKITTNEKISAIYYALWQTGYEYAGLARSAQHLADLRAHAGAGETFPFFAAARQSTCEAYAFWPRAALLETAAFHVTGGAFTDYEGLRRKIMNAPNIADAERDVSFSRWLEGFPSALAEVLESAGFISYMAWAEEWIAVQNVQHASELAQIERCINVCREKYGSPLTDVQILIDPIKCAYSADYHVDGKVFVFSSGRFLAESVVHEYLHHAVHPSVEGLRERILREERTYPDLDASYYAAGPLYAFEEQAVRQLTRLAMADDLPENLNWFMQTLLENN